MMSPLGFLADILADIMAVVWFLEVRVGHIWTKEWSRRGYAWLLVTDCFLNCMLYQQYILIWTKSGAVCCM